MSEPGPADMPVGSRLELEVGPVAHGGSCVARWEGRVVFVRHALPGERVAAVVTEGGPRDRYWRADAVEVLTASPDRVQPPCPHAGPGRCGGCDWQHATLQAQRGLKAAVVAEQLRRLASLDVPVVVEPVPGDVDGLRWRTRVHFAVGPGDRLGLHRSRSHEVHLVDDCRIASPGVAAVGATAHRWEGASSVEVVAGSTGDRAVVVTPRREGAVTRLPRLAPEVSATVVGARQPARGRTWLRESAAGRTWQVSAGGFWQVHPGAVDALVSAVLVGLEPAPGEQVLDLYAGVGVFAGALVDRVGPSGSVVAVESDERAASDARRNLHAEPAVRIVRERVDRWLGGPGAPGRVDLVVLDPPRAGAGRRVCERIAAVRPRAIAYVACDPAALARDVATFAASGYALCGLRAFDLFPMTAHVECVALLTPTPPRS